MKKILFLFGFIGLCLQLNAQDVACVPNPIYQDSGQVVSPLPLDPNTGEGGLAAFPACIGEPFELVFTFRIGDSATIGAFAINLDSAIIETTGAISGLPEGINYQCNPPNCVFPDTTLGCIVLKGTPTSNVGVNKLVISARVKGGLIDLMETIPGTIFQGEYNLTVNEAGDCTSTGVNDYLAEQISLSNSPNPVTDQTTIEITSLLSGGFEFNVFDLTGKTIHTEAVQLTTGYNAFNFDAGRLQEGMYIYTIGDGTAAVASKLIVGKR